MRPFSFGKSSIEKTSFNQNIRKLTFAIPIFAIFIAIPALLLFNYQFYNKEVKNLTEELVRDSRTEVANQVHLLCKQLSTHETVRDSILKTSLNRQSQEIQLIEEQLRENVYTVGTQQTLTTLIHQRVAIQDNLNIALFDTTGYLIVSDSIAEKEKLFDPLSSAIRFYKEDLHKLIDRESHAQRDEIIHYTIHPIPHSPYFLVTGITKFKKQKLSKEMALNNILAPLIQNSTDLMFLLSNNGDIITANRTNQELESFRSGPRLAQALEFPQGLYTTDKTKAHHSNTILFTVYLKKYNWIVGSGISLNSIRTILTKSREKILWQFLNQFLIMSSVVLLLMLLSMWYGKRLSLRMTNQFSAFMNSFYSLVKTKRGAQNSTFLYEEFDDIIKMVVDLMQDLKGSEKRFRDMAELLPVMLFECDTAGLLTYVNPAAEEIFQYKFSEVLNCYTFDFFTPEDKEKIISTIESRVTGTIDNKPRSYTALKKDGSQFNVMIHANNIVNNGKIVGIRGIITDISDQIEHEKRLKEMYDESESLNRLMIKREKRVFDIKLEVNDLLKELGKPIKYMATENLHREEHEQR